MSEETTTAGPASLQGRLAARRQELRQERYFDIDVPGYEDVLVARYQPIDYHILRRIGKNAESEPDEIQAEVSVAADSIATANIGLFEKTSTGLVDTGHRWSTSAASELFGIGPDEIPKGSTVREALRAIFPSTTSLVLHFGEFSTRSSDFKHEIDEEIQGESEAR